MLHAAAKFPTKEACLYLHPLFHWVIMETPQTGWAQSGRSRQTGTQTTESRSLAEIRSTWEPPQIRILPSLRYPDPLPPPLPQHPSLHPLLAFLHLSLPLIKTLNWLIHTCSCTGSFGTSLHHQSRFSHQLRVHSGAHCPSLTYRAKQWSQIVCGGWVNVLVFKASNVWNLCTTV